MLRSRTKYKTGYLKVFQANVARGQTNHDLALAQASAENFNIILVQEPWILSHRDRKVTKQHPDYDIFSPTEDWDTRPRVMTYVRKNENLDAYQLRPGDTPDICWIKIKGTIPPLNIVNVYRPPQEAAGGAVITALKTWQVPSNSIVAGDFNTRHTLWDIFATNSNRSEELAEWAHTNSLFLASPANESTHTRGSVLDLVFTNILGTQSSIEKHLHTTSDHETLVTTIPIGGRIHGPQRKQYKLNAESTPRFALGVKESIDPRKLPLDPDLLAQKIVQSIVVNMELFLPRKKNRAQGTKWWNNECKQKAAAYRRARREGDSTVEKQNLRRATRKAKKEYWQHQIQNANGPEDIFKITRWQRSRQRFASPPITHEGQVYTDPASKGQFLKRALLERRSASEDIIFEPELEGLQPKLHVSDCIEESEVKLCVFHGSNTAPGLDGISVCIIRACWDGIKDAVVFLYRQCIKLGYHPENFRKAEIVFLPKPNKRDLSSPKSWRPISLLSCLGKGLERLIARRLSIAALKQNVLSPQQFGALPKRSATDLVSCLIHDIEKARSRDMMASLLTLDIKGAFDSVLPGRLLERLYEQGWPNWLIKWVRSFMNNRTAVIRFDGFRSQETPLICGLPQGSPASPILFLLYTEPILRLGKRNNKYSYADDVAILQVGRTLSECNEKLAHEAHLILEWGAENAVSFEHEKSELQHFTVAPRPKEYPSLTIGETVIDANQVTRWLGIWLDRKLSFLTHTKNWTAKAFAVAAHLRRLNNTQRGSPPHLVQQAIKTCVLSTALYGVEAWWPGESIITWNKGNHKLLKNRSGLHLKQFSKAIISGIRAALPVFKTTPLPVLHRESGIPPINILLHEARLKHALRIQTLDANHPLKKKACGNFLTRLTQTARLIPISEDALHVTIDERYHPTSTNLIPSRHDIHVYTDGSCNPAGKAGGGFVIYQAEQKIMASSFSINRKIEPIDAEIIAISRAIKACHQQASTKFANNLIVYTDNKTAAEIVNGKRTLTSRKEAAEISMYKRSWNSREKLPHVKAGNISGKWVPSHSGIAANEEADRLAKTGAESGVSTYPHDSPSYAAVKQQVYATRKKILTEWWQKQSPTRYRELGITMSAPGKCPAELHLSRKTVHFLISARTRHGDFKEYHQRFQHENYNSCSCGADKKPEHFFFCRETRSLVKKQVGKRKQNEAITWLLGTSEGAKALDKVFKKFHSNFTTSSSVDHEMVQLPNL